MSANPRFQIGDVVEFDPSSGVNLNGASRGPFQIDSEPLGLSGKRFAARRAPCRRQHRRTAMQKCTNTYKAYLNYESEFSHHCACWAANHNGWAKMKKANKRIAKRRLKQDIDKRLRREEFELL